LFLNKDTPYMLCLKVITENQMNTQAKFAAIKLIKHDTLLVKTPDQPITIKLNITDPLTTAQMRMLATASPYSPLIINTQVGKWNDDLQAMDAKIVTIESLSKQPVSKHRNTLRWGLVKRKRGYFSHD